jgi:hypothetical protein
MDEQYCSRGSQNGARESAENLRLSVVRESMSR